MNLKDISIWKRVFRWKALCAEIEFDMALLKSQAHANRQQLEHHKEQLEAHKTELDKAKAGNRTALKFIMQAHGLKLKLAILFLSVALPCMAQFPPPFIHNPLDTNTLGLAPGTTYFLGWNGTKPAWGVPPDLTGMFVAVNTNAVAVTNGSLVTISGVTDTNAVRGLIMAATNNDALVSIAISNYVATISANATNNDANSTNFALLIGSNGTNNDNLHALNNTNFSLLLGVNATNNDANSTNFALLIGSNATNNDANSTNFTLLVGGNDTNEVTRQAATKQMDGLNTANFVIIEDFPNSSSSDLLIGTHGWKGLKAGNGSLQAAFVTAGHPGVFVLGSGNTSGDGAVVILGGNTNSTTAELLPSGLDSTIGWTNTWVFKVAATNSCLLYMGLANDLVYLGNEPADWMGLQINATTNTSFMYHCGKSAAYTAATGPTLDTASWHKFQMWSTVAGTINFTIDGANLQSISSNVPSAATSPMAMVYKLSTTTGFNFSLDYMSMVMTGISR